MTIFVVAVKSGDVIFVVATIPLKLIVPEQSIDVTTYAGLV